MKEITRGSKTIFRGRILQLKLLNVKLPDKKYSTREIVFHPGAVAIVPVLPGGRIILVRQYRKAVERELLEVPAGTMDKGESPIACAGRELIEETGYKARFLKKLLEFYPSPGYCNERIYVFKATGLRKIGGRKEPDEFIETVILPLSKVKKLIRRGRIRDGKTLIALGYFI